MSDLIDREAVLQLVDEHLDPIVAVVSRGGNGGAHRKQLLAALRSLPAAVPVVDVEKAAGFLRSGRGSVAVDLMTNDKYAAARAILSAGYVGSVSVEDLKRAALYLEAENTPEAREIAKRLLSTLSKGD